MLGRSAGLAPWDRCMIRRLLAALTVLLASTLQAGAEGTVLRRGNAAEPDTLDPHKYSLAAESNIQRDMFLPLTEYNARSRPVPGAAERWTHSPDGLVWTFHLRAGLVWSDGVPVTAEDFVAGMRRGLDPKTQAQFANLAYFIKNAEHFSLTLGRLLVKTFLGIGVYVRLTEFHCELTDAASPPAPAPSPSRDRLVRGAVHRAFEPARFPRAVDGP